MTEALKTPAWEADIKLMVKSFPEIDRLPKGDYVDILAVWHQLSDPERKLNTQRVSNDMNQFGFNRRFDGVGLFLFRDRAGDYKMMAVADMGLERIDMENLDAKFMNMENGCKVPPAILNTGFTIMMSSN